MPIDPLHNGDASELPLAVLLEHEAELDKEAADQRYYMEEIGPFCTSSEEQLRDSFRLQDILQKLALVKAEIQKRQQSPHD